MFQFWLVTISVIAVQAQDYDINVDTYKYLIDNFVKSNSSNEDYPMEQLFIDVIAKYVGNFDATSMIENVHVTKEYGRFSCEVIGGTFGILLCNMHCRLENHAGGACTERKCECHENQSAKTIDQLSCHIECREKKNGGFLIKENCHCYNFDDYNSAPVYIPSLTIPLTIIGLLHNCL